MQTSTEQVTIPDAEEVLELLLTAYGNNVDRLRRAGAGEWTDFYLDFFCDPMHGKIVERACCKARGSSAPFVGITPRSVKGYEFQFDLCWFPDWSFEKGCYEVELTQSLPLILESENGTTHPVVSRNEVFYDFAKLVYARAHLKVMLFGFHQGAAELTDFDSMADWMQRSATQAGDRDASYLLVGSPYGWREQHEPLRTRIFRV